MANYRTSRILPIALVVIIIIIAIAAIVSLARVVFFSGSTPAAQTDISRDALLSTTAGRSVVMTVRGPIVADEEFYSYSVKITPNARTLKTYHGYLGDVVDRISLSNSVAAYEQFVYALDKANLAKGTELEGDKNDVRGVCAVGRVYEFSILNNSKSVKRLWTSTCSGSKGSLNASVAQLTALFTDQIPDSSKLINHISI